MGYIDCHCHLAENFFYRQIDKLIMKWRELGVERIGAMSTDIKTSIRNIELASSYSEMIIAGVGRHPWGAHKTNKEELLKFEELIKNPKVLVIGEIGLDNYFIKDKEKLKQQIPIFKFFLDLANKYSKSLMIHSTGADDLLMEILSSYKIKSNVCFHWFSGSLKNLKAISDLGGYCSINPAFIRSKKHQKVLDVIDVNFILTESDGIVKFQGEVGSPELMPKLCQEIALYKNNSIESIVNNIQANFINFLKN